MDYSFDNKQEFVGTSLNDNSANSIPPKNNLALAIFTTACCCLPLGIYAIILSNKVNTCFSLGQYEAAERYANDAKKWSVIGIIVGLICQIIYASIFLLNR